MATPRDSKASIDNIDFSIIPNWDFESVQKAFIEIRDRRFILDPEDPDFLRRIPWLFVENGCYLRAALVRRKLRDLGFPGIKKLFVFGDMKFQSKPPLNESITFKDHVACVARVDSDVFVFDPPMNFESPLSLEKWINSLFMGSSEKYFELSLASEFTLSHNSPVDAANEEDEVGIKGGQTRDVNYLTTEWLRKERQHLKKMGFNSCDMLGENPPWL